MPSITAQVNAEIKNAMLAKDAERLGAMRLIKTDLSRAALDSATELDHEAELAVLRRMAKQRRDSIEQFRAGDREELAQKEEGELAIIEAFLPAGLSDEKMNEIIESTLAELGAHGPKDAGKAIGKVMGALKATGLSYDGKAASDKVRARLASGG